MTTKPFPLPNNIELKYYKVRKNVPDLKYATDGSACFDLTASLVPGEHIKFYSLFNKELNTKVSEDETITISHGDRILVPTGIIFDIPSNYSVRIYVRSSVALKLGVSLANSEAVIDSDYCHETFVMLHCISESSVKIKNGDRIAQAEIVPVYRTTLTAIDTPPSQKTDRNGGFGSTGK